MKKKIFYKLADPSGWDFFSGETINYRENIGKTVKPPQADVRGALCSSAFIHASNLPNECFVGASIPLSAYRVEGRPVLCDTVKCGFLELAILEEITDLDKLFGWNYTELLSAISPVSLPQATVTEEVMSAFNAWRVAHSLLVGGMDNITRSVSAEYGYYVRYEVWQYAWRTTQLSAYNALPVFPFNAADAYIGSMFPNVKEWLGCEYEEGVYPFQAGADLWKMGVVPCYESGVWRLHSGTNAEVIY